MNTGKAKPKRNITEAYFTEFRRLHLWLGRFWNCYCHYLPDRNYRSFKDEITDWLHPELQSDYIPDKPMLNPSALYQKAKTLSGSGTFLHLASNRKAVMIGYGKRNPGYVLYLDPIQGLCFRALVLKKNSIFEWTLNGHRYLWLPSEIGRPIINYSTFIFSLHYLPDWYSGGQENGLKRCASKVFW